MSSYRIAKRWEAFGVMTAYRNSPPTRILARLASRLLIAYRMFPTSPDNQMARVAFERLPVFNEFPPLPQGEEVRC